MKQGKWNVLQSRYYFEIVKISSGYFKHPRNEEWIENLDKKVRQYINKRCPVKRRGMLRTVALNLKLNYLVSVGVEDKKIREYWKNENLRILKLKK